MPVKYLEFYTRQFVASNQDAFFVFGDNEARCGIQGQARACRGFMNTIGITTKKFPGNKAEDYYDKESFHAWYNFNQTALQRIADLLWINKAVVYFPKDGIGTGFAQLAQRCPEILQFIKRWTVGMEQVGEAGNV
jgi:hypothetical protein